MNSKESGLRGDAPLSDALVSQKSENINHHYVNMLRILILIVSTMIILFYRLKKQSI